MKNCKRPHYEKLKSLKSGFIENSIFENNRDPCPGPRTMSIDVLADGVKLVQISPPKNVGQTHRQTTARLNPGRR